MSCHETSCRLGSGGRKEIDFISLNKMGLQFKIYVYSWEIILIQFIFKVAELVLMTVNIIMIR
jgi:hypothetical protein